MRLESQIVKSMLPLPPPASPLKVEDGLATETVQREDPRIIEMLRNDNDFLRRQNAVLQRDKRLLESAFAQKIAENKPRYEQMRAWLDQMEKEVFDSLAHSCATMKRPLTYNEITEGYYRLYPARRGKVSIETVTRCIRKLQEKGDVESRAVDNRTYFFPVLNPLKSGD